VNVLDSFGCSVPRSQLPSAVQSPETDWKRIPALGSGVTKVLGAGHGPLFVTVPVYWMTSPTFAADGPVSFATRSANGLATLVTLAVCCAMLSPVTVIEVGPRVVPGVPGGQVLGSVGGSSLPSESVGTGHEIAKVMVTEVASTTFPTLQGNRASCVCLV